MNSIITDKKVWPLFGIISSLPYIDAEAKLRRILLAFFMLLGIFLQFGFASYHFYAGTKITGYILLVVGIGFSIILASYKSLSNTQGIFRVIAVLLAVLLLYSVAEGGHDGSMILWMYIFPPLALFFLGKKEGLLWILALFLPAVMLILFPNMLETYPYDTGLVVRFVVTFSMVSFFAYGIELLRFLIHEKLVTEHQNLVLEKKNLQKALKEIKILQGILPICTHCKKIRDDSGYWKRMESYISTYSDVEFSHGICPECAPKVYPEFKLYDDPEKK